MRITGITTTAAAAARKRAMRHCDGGYHHPIIGVELIESRVMIGIPTTMFRRWDGGNETGGWLVR